MVSSYLDEVVFFLRIIFISENFFGRTFITTFVSYSLVNFARNLCTFAILKKEIDSFKCNDGNTKQSSRSVEFGLSKASIANGTKLIEVPVH